MAFRPDGPEKYSDASFFRARTYRQKALEGALDLDSKLCELRPWANAYRDNAVFMYDEPDVILSLDLHGHASDTFQESLSLFLSFCENQRAGKINVVHGKGEVLSELAPAMAKGLGYKVDESEGHFSVFVGGGSIEFGCLTLQDEEENRQILLQEQREAEEARLEQEAEDRRRERERERLRLEQERAREEREREWREQERAREEREREWRARERDRLDRERARRQMSNAQSRAANSPVPTGNEGCLLAIVSIGTLFITIAVLLLQINS